MRALITGNAGTGKSTVCKELLRRGQAAFDGDDVPNLGGWFDLRSGERTTVDVSGVIDHSAVAWNWDPAVLDELQAENPAYFLCGRSSNQRTLYGTFDHIFVLDVSPETHSHRLVTRPKAYGKDPEMRRIIIEEQSELSHEAQTLGAVAINACRPIGEVVDEILWHAAEEQTATSLL